MSVLTVDSRRAVAMFDRLARNVDRVPGAVQRSGRKLLDSITGIPVGETGDLAASPRLEMRESNVRVVSSVEYAHYVLYGTKYMDAQPPHVGYRGPAFARDIAIEVFKA